MKIFVETPRLLLREMVTADDKDMFELNADVEVMKYLAKPYIHINQAREQIEIIRQQYKEDGIGRWAVVDKATDEFLGWSGLKVVKEVRNGHTNFYDLGYRIKSKHWGKGFATESAKAALNYAFLELNQNIVYGMTHVNNLASRNVLEKTGLKYISSFDLDGMPHYWFEISKIDWEEKRGTN